MDEKSYVLETFADIEDEFCVNRDYVEGNRDVIETDLDCVTSEKDGDVSESFNISDEDSFEWPEDGSGCVFVRQLDIDEVEDEGDKHIQCPDCEYATNRQSNFNRHVKTVHKYSYEMNKCEYCDKAQSFCQSAPSPSERTYRGGET